MSTGRHGPSLLLRAIGWVTTPMIYIVLIRIVIDGVRHPPTYSR